MSRADQPVSYASQFNTGLTIREHFAGLAMQGLLSAGASAYEPRTATLAWHAADNLLRTSKDEYLVEQILLLYRDVAAYQDRLPKELSERIQYLLKHADESAELAKAKP